MLEQKLLELKKWIEDHIYQNEGKPLYWSLYNGKTKSNLIFRNVKVGDIQESFELLQETILTQYKNGVKQFLVAYKTGESNNRNPTFPLKFDDRLSLSSSITGFGNGGSNGFHPMAFIGQIQTMQNNMFAQQMSTMQQMHQIQLESSIKQLELKHERDKAQEELEAVYESETSIGERLLNTCAPIIEAIGTQFMANYMNVGEGKAMITGTHIEDEEQEGAAHQTTKEMTLPPETEQGEGAKGVDWNIMFQVIEDLKQHFKRPDLELQKIALFVKQDPTKAKLFLNTLKGMLNE